MPADPYLTPADIRSRVGSGAATLPPDDTAGNALIAEWIAEFEEIAEDYRGVAFTPRTETLTATANNRGAASRLLLRPLVRSVTSLTVAGDVAAPTTYTVSGADGILDYTSGFAYGQAITVVYEHGMDAPPQRLKRACHQYVIGVARSENAGTSRDVIAQSFDGGTTRYSTPDKSAGRPTGWLEVDRLLNSLPDYRIPGAA